MISSVCLGVCMNDDLQLKRDFDIKCLQYNMVLLLLLLFKVNGFDGRW